MLLLTAFFLPSRAFLLIQMTIYKVENLFVVPIMAAWPHQMVGVSNSYFRTQNLDSDDEHIPGLQIHLSNINSRSMIGKKNVDCRYDTENIFFISLLTHFFRFDNRTIGPGRLSVI